MWRAGSVVVPRPICPAVAPTTSTRPRVSPGSSDYDDGMPHDEDREIGDSSGQICADCGTGPVAIYLDGIPLCDSCHDVRISKVTGRPRLPGPPPPETITGPDGRDHLIAYRVWRSPVGIAVEASEGDRSSEGYFAQMVGSHEADVATLVEQTKAAIRRRIARQDLVLSPSGNMIMAEKELWGRLVWQDRGMPYGVVIDGREMSWEEFGLAMEPFEGWEFRISFDEGVVGEGGLDPPTEDATASTLPPAPDEHIH